MLRQALKQKSKHYSSPLARKDGDRGRIWEEIRGMWKNRKPDPIKEWQKLRKEWEQDVAGSVT